MMFPLRLFRLFSLIVVFFGGWKFQSVAAQSLTLTAQVKPVSCFGGSDGSLNVQVSGNQGAVDFSYQGILLVNAQLTQLKSGVYTIVAEDSVGTVDSILVSVNQPLPVSVNISKVLPSCFYSSNGKLIATASGGTGKFSYYWTDSSGGNFNQSVANYLVHGTYFLHVSDSLGCTLDSTVNLGYYDSIEVSIDHVDVSCSGLSDGQASPKTINSIGNSFNYSWSGPSGYTSNTKNISSLAPGSYQLKVINTQTQCSAVNSVVIVRPDSLKLSLTKTIATLCKGSADGTLESKVTGGRTPYSATWTGPNSYYSTSFNIYNVAAGSYTLQVTDSSGCVSQLNTQVLEPSALSVTPTIVNNSCFGNATGSVTLNVTGGVKPYTYSWSNSMSSQAIQNLKAGNYSVTVMDSNGCSLNRTYSISSPSQLVLNQSSSNVKCYGGADGSLTLLASGGTFPWTYSVKGPSGYNSTTASNKNLSAGNYLIVLRDNNNCTDSASVNITQPASLSVSKKAVNSECFGTKGSMSLTVSGGTSPFSYEWTDQNSNLYAATQNVTTADPGNYTFKVTDANQCIVSDTLRIWEPSKLKLSLKSIGNNTCINDTKGELAFSTSGGTKPYSFKLNTSTSQSDSIFKNLKTGKYFVTVSDKNLCTDSTSAAIDFLDVVKPTVNLKNATLYLNSQGKATLDVAQINNGITDNCEIQSVQISKSEFDCNNLGSNTVTVTAKDFKGNATTSNCVVSVVDSIKPTLVLQTVNLYLNSSGSATLIPSQANKGNFDNCGITKFTASKTLFSCSDLGSNSITFTAEDAAGNTISAVQSVNVLDTIVPKLSYKNILLYLNSSGSASITASDIDNGSSDNCGIVKQELSQSSFNCNQLGTNFITYRIFDKAQNISSQSVRVTVIDTMKPVIKVKPVTVYLNQYGFALVAPADVDDGSFDNCKISTRVLSQSVFTCGNSGNNAVVYTLTDGSGNTITATTTIVVKDSSSPNNKTRNPMAYLDKNGFAILSTFDIDNGSSDNCGITKTTLSKDRFTCTDLGKNTVVFSTVDAAGNQSNTNIEVTVTDSIKPVMRASNRTVYLDSNGVFDLDWRYFDLGSSDNCKITKRTLSQDHFTCSDIGNRLILYTIQDTSGNSALAVLTVRVLDTISPKLFVENKKLQLNSTGNAKLNLVDFATKCTDNCSISQLYFSDSLFDCSELGVNLIRLIAKDASGNISQKSFTVEVTDNSAPVLTTKETTIYVDTAGRALLKFNQVISEATDNCNISKIVLERELFTVSDLGENWITVHAFDGSGNRSLDYWTKVNVEVGDSDKDSIPDFIERAIDFDGDGIPNYLDRDSDNDGVSDVNENSGLKVLLDLDRDGYPNVFDWDSDGDGINDCVEVNGFDPDRNGRVGIGKVLVSFWGVPLLAAGGDGYAEVFTDNDLVADYKDWDSDNDLISDKLENKNNSELIDQDKDGIPNFRDSDSDADGISDLDETETDFDQDGIPNYIDLDSDADGISDLKETKNDQDIDGIPNYLDLDSDSDGILDQEEGVEDIDNDLIGNWLDNDSDNDGISDQVEGLVDTDDDGIPDLKDKDSDGDNIPDQVEALPMIDNLPADSDADGTFDFRDIDSDNDLIADIQEGHPFQPDTDGDGTPDYRDIDSDGDGTLDILESIKDTDDDGIIDAVDEDSDNDGILDKVEGYADIDSDGLPNSIDLDSDNDGINDVTEVRGSDFNGTGTVIQGSVYEAIDTDNDGLYDFLDVDSDNDGILDVIESEQGYSDENFDGRVDGGDIDKDGIPDEADALSGSYGDLSDPGVSDTDLDGFANFQDTDSDEDGIPDIIETAEDFDMDEYPNYLDADSDGDGIMDQEETASDSDNDGVGNFVDLDSDADGIPDSTESNNDYDNDGVPNYLDLDSDDDDTDDAVEGDLDKDKNGFKDFIDPQTFVPEIFTPNNDGVNDLFEIKGLKNYPNAQLTVFNQWGVIVYKSNGPYSNQWGGWNEEKGTSNQRLILPEGIYFYILDHHRSDAPQFTKPQTKGNFYLKP